VTEPVHIFVVEDDPLIVRLYSNILKLSGYEVETAENGKIALEKLAKTAVKPALILLDVMMPEMNGMEALQAIKASETLKTIPVIMLTNLAGEEDAKKALALGASSYLIKSEYEPKEVVAKVEKFLKDGKI
jgi:CheY-like chemotaxis protein